MSEARIAYLSRPWSINAERSMHWSQRSALVDEWRTYFGWAAKARHLPSLTSARIHVRTGVGQDTGNCLPAVKAAVDGLVDAGVLPDDTPEHVQELRFLAPEKVPRGQEFLELIVSWDDEE